MPEVLIVDDNPTNLKLARVVLENEDFDVRVAVDAAGVFAALEERIPPVILMDLQLPDMGGIELTRRLKADPRYAGIAIIALTAYAMKGDREKAIAAGCDDYVTKPIDVGTLAATVRAVLTR